MPSRTKRILIIVLALAGLVGLAYIAQHGLRPPGGTPQTAAAGGAPGRPGVAGPAGSGPAGGPPLPVETARVVSTSLALEATAVGSLRSNESVILRPETAGRIAQINFRDGSAVRKGDLLLALDGATQAAELAQAQANLALARSNHQRTQDLFARKFVSRQALDNAEATLKVQEAALLLAQARFERTRIRAPFAGVVGIRSVSIGDYVKEGQDLVNLEDIGTLKIDFRLPESYLSQIRTGQRIEVTSDAAAGRKFSAVLDAINPLVEAGGRAISLRASLPNGEGLLRPGMFVRLRLILASRPNVLLVPEQAVIPDSKAPYVYRVVDGKALRAAIVTGQRREAQVEIVEGLRQGDEVVTAGQLKLREGASVRAVGEAAQAASAGAKPPAGDRPAAASSG
ncbi:MAG TPA: efflux RND transporter periplasmic adaptor subunit, partial [Accumulibacter sp.]|uniref:efflux RND transporter periplasmic adaptor subunit n=1 Tax=Accumulibacter sp. TaxID=2053492 RepID=UPI002BF2597B